MICVLYLHTFVCPHIMSRLNKLATHLALTLSLFLSLSLSLFLFLLLFPFPLIAQNYTMHHWHTTCSLHNTRNTAPQCCPHCCRKGDRQRAWRCSMSSHCTVWPTLSWGYGSMHFCRFMIGHSLGGMVLYRVWPTLSFPQSLVVFSVPNDRGLTHLPAVPLRNNGCNDLRAVSPVYPHGVDPKLRAASASIRTAAYENCM